MTQRHPDDALVTNPNNPNDTAPPRPRPGQQSPRHDATHWSAIPPDAAHPTPCSPILRTRSYPDHALVTNPQDTAPPRRRAAQQSACNTATHATHPAAIPMAQRRPRDTPSSNPHGTAAPTRHAQQSNPHGTAPHTPHARHARRPSSQPATAFHGTAPHPRHARRSLPLRSKKRPLQAHIHKSTDSLRLPRFRND